MGVAGGIFNIIQRSQLSVTASATLRVTQTQKSLIQKSAADDSAGLNPTSWTLRKNESAVAAFWRLAPESAAKNAPTVDIVKRLEKLADGNNSDITAEKMRQAKSKLEGLRRQLQMLAATGDVKQLRRIASEAAQLAREIGAAARSLAQGIGSGSSGSGATTSGDAASAQATASAANAAANSTSGSDPVPAGNATADSGSTPAATPNAAPVAASSPLASDAQAGDERSQSFKALHELTSDARNAIIQAKGIISLAAQIARSRRRGQDDDDDRYFRNLQEIADGALHDVDAGQREALGQLLAPAEGSEGELISSISEVDISLEISVSASIYTETGMQMVV
ncbi:hypothetical protein [Dongia sp.]|uniref:hypothetical protein n=1 Tax=Dongia sp. TaxID=1977262 RepID=UPI0035B29025